MQKEYGNIKFAVASLLNGMNDECLKIYEDIESGKSTNSQLSTYIKRLILEFQGFGNLYEPQIFIALISTLNGIEENLSTITHMQMKSYIFYCIDTVKKCRCDYL